MLAALLAIGLSANACPMKIGIDRNGVLFSFRMQGWYKTSVKSLESDMRGGCYNDNNPSQVTSVTLEIASNAPKQRIEKINSILEKAGWSRGRVKVETWANDPNEPR